MLRFHRTHYEVPGEGRFKARWWQMGTRIWGFRQIPVD